MLHSFSWVIRLWKACLLHKRVRDIQAMKTKPVQMCWVNAYHITCFTLITWVVHEKDAVTFNRLQSFFSFFFSFTFDPLARVLCTILRPLVGSVCAKPLPKGLTVDVELVSFVSSGRIRTLHVQVSSATFDPLSPTRIHLSYCRRQKRIIEIISYFKKYKCHKFRS